MGVVVKSGKHKLVPGTQPFSETGDQVTLGFFQSDCFFAISIISNS